MSSEQRLFRNALGCFTTGVCVVTAQTENGPIRLTINSFASVSLDPPLVLWSLDKKSDRAAAFEISEHFAINVLAESHRDLSAILAKKGARGIPEEALDPGPCHVPILRGALAQFICRVEARHDAGDHVIYVGLVERFHAEEGGEPLVYHRGAYRSLAARADS